jgi:hypothetical protein
MASDADAGIKRCLHDLEIVLERLAPRALELQEDVIVGARSQDAGFLEAHLLDELEVGLYRANPSCDFGGFVAEPLTSADRLAIDVGIKEELRLADDAARAAEPVQHLEHRDDLRDGVWRACLLAVAEGRVGDEIVGGWIERLDFAVEDDFRHGIVGENVAEKIRLGDIDKFVTFRDWVPVR